MLREAREQPLLVIFEDLHWVDGESQAFLDTLVESLGSARLLERQGVLHKRSTPWCPCTQRGGARSSGSSHTRAGVVDSRCRLNRYGMRLSIQPLDHPRRRAGLLATANVLHGAIFRLRLPVGEASLLRSIALNRSPNAS